MRVGHKGKEQEGGARARFIVTSYLDASHRLGPRWNVFEKNGSQVGLAIIEGVSDHENM